MGGTTHEDLRPLGRNALRPDDPRRGPLRQPSHGEPPSTRLRQQVAAHPVEAVTRPVGHHTEWSTTPMQIEQIAAFTQGLGAVLTLAPEPGTVRRRSVGATCSSTTHPTV